MSQVCMTFVGGKSINWKEIPVLCILKHRCYVMCKTVVVYAYRLSVIKHVFSFLLISISDARHKNYAVAMTELHQPV